MKSRIRSVIAIHWLPFSSGGSRSKKGLSARMVHFMAIRSKRRAKVDLSGQNLLRRIRSASSGVMDGLAEMNCRQDDVTETPVACRREKPERTFYHAESAPVDFRTRFDETNAPGLAKCGEGPDVRLAVHMDEQPVAGCIELVHEFRQHGRVLVAQHAERDPERGVLFHGAGHFVSVY